MPAVDDLLRDIERMQPVVNAALAWRGCSAEDVIGKSSALLSACGKYKRELRENEANHRV